MLASCGILQAEPRTRHEMCLAARGHPRDWGWARDMTRLISDIKIIVPLESYPLREGPTAVCGGSADTVRNSFAIARVSQLSSTNLYKVHVPCLHVLSHRRTDKISCHVVQNMPSVDPWFSPANALAKPSDVTSSLGK